jgi:peptidoglycan/LPS O-acetylase OafA/YrhL
MTGKNQEIERLRAIAVIGVMLAHGRFFGPFLHPVFRQGWSGVDLFFVISGYVVSMSFLRNLAPFSLEMNFFERLKSSLNTLKVFYKRRIYRILPMAVLWAILPLMLIHFSMQEQYIGIKNLSLAQEFSSIMTFSYNYFYIFNYVPRLLGHYWSLSVEEQFYFLLPFFFISVPSSGKRLKILFGLTILIALVLRFIGAPADIAAAGDSWAWTRFASHNRFDALLVGVLIYLLNSEINFKNYFHPTRVQVNFISLIAILGIFIVPGIFLDSEANRFNHTLFALCGGVLVFLSILNTGHLLNLKMLTPVLNWFGSRSYGLYLIHVPAEMFIRELNARGFNLSEVQCLVAWSCLTLIVTEVCFRLLEQPMINLGRVKQ